MDSAAHIPLFAFPVEILDLIFQELETHELSPVLRANAFFESIAVRVLYRAIPELPIRPLRWTEFRQHSLGRSPKRCLPAACR